MLDATQSILKTIGAVTVVGIVSPALMIPILLMASIFICIRRAFLKTSKSIKHLEANSELQLKQTTESNSLSSENFIFI